MQPDSSRKKGLAVLPLHTQRGGGGCTELPGCLAWGCRCCPVGIDSSFAIILAPLPPLPVDTRVVVFRVITSGNEADTVASLVSYQLPVRCIIGFHILKHCLTIIGLHSSQLQLLAARPCGETLFS